ncbi:MAG: tyrosine-type recombinase/integrase, partial [Streptosporangiaceae bacterium]
DRGRRGLVAAGESLTDYEPALRLWMRRRGYAPLSVSEAVQAMRRLSRWVGGRGLDVAGLTPTVFEEFLAARRRSCSNLAVARRWSGVVSHFLRDQGVLTVPNPAQGSEVEKLLAGFGAWLVSERGLATETVRCYRNQAKTFLVWLPEPLGETLSGLTAVAVTGFVLERSAASSSTWSAKAQVTALRALLRFLHIQGLIPAPLVAAVPGVAGWRLSELPRSLPAAQVTALLAAHDLRTPVGLRDHAVLLTLARLGLRGGEIAALGLADVDWRAGQLVVHGKGARTEALPLPVEVGQALGDYVTKARPRCGCSTLFVTVRAPYQPLSPAAVRAIMGRACRRAGLPRLGAHRLRHTLACDLLRAGSSLAEIGQVLRHRAAASTAVYAKVDHASLRALARRWPGDAR